MSSAYRVQGEVVEERPDYPLGYYYRVHWDIHTAISDFVQLAKITEACELTKLAWS